MHGWTSRVLMLGGMLVLSLVCTIPASANGSVPLEYARVRSMQGLELRDAFNQPVARADVDRGIRHGVRAQEKRAASLSKLPGLHALLVYLEELDQLAAKLNAPGSEGNARISAAAHRVPKRTQMKAPAIRSYALAPTVDPIAALHPLQLSSTPGRIRVLPLLI